MASRSLRIGVAHHFGWAVVVTADADHEVVDRRRIELVEPGVANAPIHHEGAGLDDVAAAALVAEVRASAVRSAAEELDRLAADVSGQVVSLSLRAWPDDFPTDITTMRRTPYEAQADSVMYRQVIAELAEANGWAVHLFDATTIEAAAVDLAGGGDVLTRPRARIGPPWNKDHRIAFAATIVASASSTREGSDRG